MGLLGSFFVPKKYEVRGGGGGGVAFLLFFFLA